MPVPSTIADLDAVANNNSPAGSESAKGTVDDYLRSHAAFIKQVDDKVLLRAPIASPTFTGTVGGVTAAMVGAVALTGNQTVAGVKTFSSSPVVPTPTTDMQASTKKYVDDSAFDAADLASVTHAATGKTTPVDADELPFIDSAASNALKKLTWSNLVAGVKAYFAATGDAPVFACRAWINFKGATAEVYGSGNATLTRNGQGDYTINFTQAMPTAGYAVAITVNGGALRAPTVTNTSSTGVIASSSETGDATLKTVNAVRIVTGRGDSSNAIDHGNISVMIFA